MASLAISPMALFTMENIQQQKNTPNSMNYRKIILQNEKSCVCVCVCVCVCLCVCVCVSVSFSMSMSLSLIMSRLRLDLPKLADGRKF